MEKSWATARRLETQYRIKHLFLGVPQVAHLTNETAALLQAQMFSANKVMQPHSAEELRKLARQTRRRVRFLPGSNLTVIRSRVAPSPSLLFRCSRNLTSYQLEDFV